MAHAYHTLDRLSRRSAAPPGRRDSSRLVGFFIDVEMVMGYVIYGCFPSPIEAARKEFRVATPSYALRVRDPDVMSTAATAGTVIEGKYRLERELGAGGMGSVWLATQLMVERNVAVKLLHPAFIGSDDIQARFEVEAKAIGRLHHPNCITLFDFGFSEDLNAFYTVIEYIDGESLDKRLTRRLPLDEIVGTIRQIAMALGHAHHQGILHRDLKPENVMVSTMTDGSEMVKVLDFGIARIVKGDSEPGAESAEQQRLTKAGEVFGTPAYMSPEQARSTRSLTPAADLYSLGVMFYELVAGGLPFFANSAFDLLMMHVTKPVPPIERAGVPDELNQIIYKLLEKEPEKRFQSGPELVIALDRLELPKQAAGDVLDDDFEAGPTRITPPPSEPIHPPAGLDRSGEFTNPNVGRAPTPTLAGFPDAGQSGSFEASAAVDSSLPADASTPFTSDASGAFGADGSNDPGGPFDSSPITGLIDIGRKRRIVAISLVILLLLSVAAILAAIVLFDNGDAGADPAVENANEPDLLFEEPDQKRADHAVGDDSLELAAGSKGPDAGRTEGTDKESEEEIESQAGASTSPTPTLKPPVVEDSKPAPTEIKRAKTTTRPKRTTRRRPPTPKDPPKKKDGIIELSIDEDNDVEGSKVEELSLD